MHTPTRSVRALLAAFAALGAFASLSSAQSVVTNPVGAISFSSGAAPVGGKAFAYNAISLAKPVAHAGTIDSQVNGTTSTIVDDSATWATAALDAGARYPTHYIEIVSGAAQGLTFDIVSSNADNKSIVVDADLTTFDLTDASYRIRQHWTLGGLFGDQNPVGIKRGNVTTADLVSVWTGSGFTSFYHRQSQTQNGWRTSDSISQDEALAVIYPDQGIFFKRMDNTPLNVTYVGDVRADLFSISIDQGFNLVSAFSAKDVTLGDSTLYTGSSATGLKAGNATTADTVSIWDGSSFKSYYVRSTVNGVQGWRSTTDVSNDASSVVIPAGASIIIRRKSDVPSFVWNRPEQIFPVASL